MKAASRDGDAAGGVTAPDAVSSSSPTQPALQSSASAASGGRCGAPGATAGSGLARVGTGPGRLPGEAVRVLRRSSVSFRRRSTRSRIPATDVGDGAPAGGGASPRAAGWSGDSSSGPPSATRRRIVRLQCSDGEAGGRGRPPEAAPPPCSGSGSTVPAPAASAAGAGSPSVSVAPGGVAASAASSRVTARDRRGRKSWRRSERRLAGAKLYCPFRVAKQLTGAERHDGKSRHANAGCATARPRSTA